MPTPRPEADMLHMQHAHVVALLARQHEAALLRSQRDAAAVGTLDAEPTVERGRGRRAPKIHRPRPA